MAKQDALEVLTTEECLSLLAGQPVGRVAVTMAALPAVFPVNFALLDGDVVFATGKGTKLQAALDHAVVAFEVDGYDTFCHAGWSVLVQGVASELTTPGDIARARRLPLRPWAAGPRSHFIRISTEIISGRRLPGGGARGGRGGPGGRAAAHRAVWGP